MPSLVEIFQTSQHVTTSDIALSQLKKLYKTTDIKQFEEPFINCVKKLLQSKQTIYFKTCSDFVCKFLQHLSKLSDEIKNQDCNAPTKENTAPLQKAFKVPKVGLGPSTSNNATTTKRATRQAATKRASSRRKAVEMPEDELVMNFFRPDPVVEPESADEDEITMIDQPSVKKQRTSLASESTVCAITDHDRLISACMDVANHYMQVINDECRLNAVFFICKFLTSVESLDEEICNAMKHTLAVRIRDRKPMIRAQAVLASRTFQDIKLTREAFHYHFYHDPEPVVRKALLQIMDTKVFGFEFLIDSTQDAHEILRKRAFHRLASVPPTSLSVEQLHRVLNNGLNERERQAAYSFKTHTLESWLKSLYDGVNIYQLLQAFDIVSHHADACRLLELIYERDLDDIQNNGASTKLHTVVESFRDSWLNTSNTCLPAIDKVDERNITVWFSLVKYCKKNQTIIKPVRVRQVQTRTNDPNESIEQILDSQQQVDDVAELYERLTPDLVNLVDFLQEFVEYASTVLAKDKSNISKFEFIYSQIMEFISTYEVGDELERKTVHEVFETILKENKLTGYFCSFVPPLVKCLYLLIYTQSPRLMINYISELINNVRSHLEDLSEQPNSLRVFKNHTNDLLKCFQMYYGCITSVRVTHVPQIMINNLEHLSYECLEFKVKINNPVYNIMIACNGATAVLDEDFARKEEINSMFTAALFENIELQTIGFKSLVDILCQHENLNVPMPRVEKFLKTALSDYGKYNPKEMKKNEIEFTTAIVEGAAKLFYFQKSSSPEILSHLILWWYHPRTHPKLRQFIGIFLPLLVDDSLRKQKSAEDTWLKDLLEDTYVVCICYLHEYILGPGINIMNAADMHSLISFLTNLVPVSCHPGILVKIDEKIEESDVDLIKYLKYSKLNLTASTATAKASLLVDGTKDQSRFISRTILAD